MPYRRLPNTDNARIKALRTVIEQCSASRQVVLNLNIPALKNMLFSFDSARKLYLDSLKRQSSENVKFQKQVKNARLYISHFIQVLNFCIIRGEIKKEQKSYYMISPDDFTVPDLSSNEALLTWGENIIKGEQQRIARGGAPIYSPTIARVNVAYSQFKDGYFSQKTHQATTARQLEALANQREDIDKTLYSIWNQIEETFADLPAVERLAKCKQYGVVYYLRKGEREASEDN